MKKRDKKLILVIVIIAIILISTTAIISNKKESSLSPQQNKDLSKYLNSLENKYGGEEVGSLEEKLNSMNGQNE